MKISLYFITKFFLSYHFIFYQCNHCFEFRIRVTIKFCKNITWCIMNMRQFYIQIIFKCVRSLWYNLYIVYTKYPSHVSSLKVWNAFFTRGHHSASSSSIVTPKMWRYFGYPGLPSVQSIDSLTRAIWRDGCKLLWYYRDYVFAAKMVLFARCC